MKTTLHFVHLRSASFLALAAGCLLTTQSSAQWSSQTLQLQPGWNAVYLEVQPEPGECDAAFNGTPVEAVWRWNRSTSPVQFIQDVNEPIADPRDWLTWLPPGQPTAELSSLFYLDAARPHLIKVRTNAAPFSWTIRGRPVRRDIEWAANSFNLVGFPLPTTGGATFQSFFAGAAGLRGQAVYGLAASGAWVEELNPAGKGPRSGESFWIQATGLPTFQGPWETDIDKREGLNFGSTLTEFTFRIRNASETTAQRIELRLLPSDPAPMPGFAPMLGDVPLSYWSDDYARTHAGAGWLPWAGVLASNIPPRGTWQLRVEVRRRDMPVSGIGAFRSFLELRDAGGLLRQLIPVFATRSEPAGSGAGGGIRAEARSSAARMAGLWIGTATITNVSQPASSEPHTPKSTASELSFRVLIHVANDTNACLLQKVLQMWKPGTYRPADDGSGFRVADQPGQFVLLTDERLAGAFAGATLRDGMAVGRRISSAAFGFRNPIEFTNFGNFGDAGARFSCTVNLDYRDPLNPFLHRYHPDHDNLDERYEQTLPEGQESYTVTRLVELEPASDPHQMTLSGWGDTQVGGVYRETLTGLHHQPLYISGTFRLHLASRVGTLNDGH